MERDHAACPHRAAELREHVAIEAVRAAIEDMDALAWREEGDGKCDR